MKGQATMEYLMTYGWAILIIIVVIGVLWKMGVFDYREDIDYCFDVCVNNNYTFSSYQKIGANESCICLKEIEIPLCGVC